MNSEYTREPKTLEEFFGNAKFQLEGVEGWMASGMTENAWIKAECLVEAAKQLEAALRAAKGDGK